MNSFRLCARERRRRRRAPDRSGPGRKIHRRRHQSDRSHEGERRAPLAADRHHASAAQPDRGDRRRRFADRRAGSQQRSCLPPADRGALPVARQCDPRRGLAQLRNMASTGGNLLQRTRCLYFYDIATPCNKREPGSGCSAIGGLNRMNAILGTSDACIAVHPSDMCVALAVLEANVHVTGPRGERVIAFADFHRLPADTPQRDTNLDADELVTSIELPPRGFATNYTYLKIRDRLSYAFALVSVAVGLELEGGAIKEARFALGGVAHKPWRNARGRSCAPRPPPKRGGVCSGGRIWSCARPRASGTTRSRSNSRAGRSSARCRRRRAARRSRSPTRRSREQPMAPYIGTATSRVDGLAKVTGAAKYAAEFNVPGLAHGSVVCSTIAKGRITRIDTSAAMRVEGVLTVLTHENRPPMANNDQAYKDEVAPSGSPFRPLYDNKIMFNGQPIGLVVAETSEIARFAASLVRVEYDQGSARHGRLSPARPGRTAEASDQSDRGSVHASEDARRTRAGTRCGRSAPRGRILRSDRASQPDGALRLDGDLRGQRQAHGLRQDPGRAERAEVSLRRVRHEAGRCAGHVAIHGRRLSAQGCARSFRWCWRCSRRARCSARCVSC